MYSLLRQGQKTTYENGEPNMKFFPAPFELYDALKVEDVLEKKLNSKVDDDSLPDMLKRFEVIRELRQYTEKKLRALEQEAVEQAWLAGATWADLGAAAGISRQTAQQTYRPSNTRTRRATQRENESWKELLQEENNDV